MRLWLHESAHDVLHAVVDDRSILLCVSAGKQRGALLQILFSSPATAKVDRSECNLRDRLDLGLRQISSALGPPLPRSGEIRSPIEIDEGTGR